MKFSLLAAAVAALVVSGGTAGAFQVQSSDGDSSAREALTRQEPGPSTRTEGNSTITTFGDGRTSFSTTVTRGSDAQSRFGFGSRSQWPEGAGRDPLMDPRR